MPQTIFTLPNLIEAYYSCRHNKRRTFNALRVEANLEATLIKLQRQLANRTYHPGRSICFVVTTPKVREVFAADFTDRIIHHLLIQEIERYFEPTFIDTSYACRTNRGTHKAAEQVQADARQLTANGRRPGYYMQVDIASFFMSIDKQTLCQIVAKRINQLPQPAWWKDEVLWLAQTIINHQPSRNFHKRGKPHLFSQVPSHKSLFGVPGTQGLPIGNLTSQFFANVYLNQLDQQAKRVLKIKHYYRYADDILMLHQDPAQLRAFTQQLHHFLQTNLHLRLHPDKQKLDSLHQGVDFVGYIIYPHHQLVRQRIVRSMKNKLYYHHQGWTQAPTPAQAARYCATVNSYLAHFRQAHSRHLRRNLSSHFAAYWQPHFTLNPQQTSLQPKLRR